jgi:phosphoribosylamine-glycine ligase
MLEGNLGNVDFEKKASVVTYKAPPSYAGYATVFQDRVDDSEVDTAVDLSQAEKLSARHRENIRVYPASIEIREDGLAYALGSRAVCVVGTADSIQDAREISLEGVHAIRGGALWNRNDIASREHIARSIEHMDQLRSQMP